MTDETDKVTEQLYVWLKEAADLRYGAAQDPEGPLTVPEYQEGPAAFVQVLIRARRRADRIEELLQSARRVRARLYAAKKEADDAAEDKLDKALVDGQSTKPEYSLGIERKASANLQAFEERRAARVAQRRLLAADEVCDALKDIHFGLSGWRTDIRDILRSFQLESNLER